MNNKKTKSFLTFIFLVGIQPLLNYASENNPAIPSAAEKVLQQKNNLKTLQKEYSSFKAGLRNITRISQLLTAATILLTVYGLYKYYFPSEKTKTRRQRINDLNLAILDQLHHANEFLENKEDVINNNKVHTVTRFC